jgi:hypothetical protein
MKKLLIVLLALAVLGVFAFAQDAAAPALKITGSIDSGVTGIYGDSADSLKNYDLFNSGDATRALTDLSYVSGNFTLASEINSSVFINRLTNTQDISAMGTPGKSLNPLAEIEVASVKGTFFDNMLGVEFGASNNGDFGVSGENGANYFGNGGYNNNGVTGAVITVTPMAGLEFGYALPLTSAGNSPYDALAYSRFGFAYSMPKMVTIKAGYALTRPFSAAQLDVSASVAAVDNLGLVLEGYFQNLGNVDKSGIDLFDVNVNYTMGAIQPGIVAEVKTFANSDIKMQWQVRPSVNYTIGQTTLTGVVKVVGVPDVTKTDGTNATYYSFRAYVSQAFTSAISGKVGVLYGNDGNALTGLNGYGGATGDNDYGFSASLSVAY